MPFCEKCGAELSETDEKCPRCGHPVGEEAETPTSQAAQKPPAPVAAPPPAAAPPPQPAKPTPWAIWSLVLGILSIVFCPVCAPFALWTGVRSNREGEGSGMAMAGIVLGIVGCLGLLVVIGYLLLMAGIIGAGIASGEFGAILPLL